MTGPLRVTITGLGSAPPSHHQAGFFAMRAALLLLLLRCARACAGVLGRVRASEAGDLRERWCGRSPRPRQGSPGQGRPAVERQVTQAKAGQPRPRQTCEWGNPG